MVVSVKMDVVHDYQTILETIEREQKNLVYAFMSKTLGDANYSSTDKTQQDAIWYAIFQKVFVFYTDACERVIHQPYLKYVGNVYHQKADRIKRWSPQLTNRFASMEKGRQPKEYFRTEQIDPEIDSVENRFILFTLHELGKRLTAFALKLSKLDSVSQDYVNRINDQSQALLEMSTHPFFKRVGRFKGFRQDSLVLQKRQGYAQIYASWLTLKNALDPTGTDVDIGYRPISALYEFWCFLAMRDHLVGHYGMPVETIGDISKLSDLLDDETEGNESESLCKMDVVFMDTTGKRRITLSYQKTYGTRTTEETFAHLNSQRPDIVLTIQESETTSDHTVFTYLFDAKYRISDFGGKDASPREAINDMHRYRDAILYRAQQRNGLAHEIIGAYVLFPGRPLPQSYDYQKTIQAENIGAIPLLPTTEGKQSLHSFLGNVLAKRGIKKHLATAIPPRGTSINLSNTSDVAIFLRDAPVKGVQECAIKEGVYPAPLTSTATPELIEWIPLSISNHPVRMLQVLEYLGQQSSHEILSAYPLFMTHNVQFGEKMFHLWKIKECDKE
jgi:hypothetical protein